MLLILTSEGKKEKRNYRFNPDQRSSLRQEKEWLFKGGKGKNHETVCIGSGWDIVSAQRHRQRRGKRAAIQRWRAAGNVFAVATARIHQAYPKVSADLGFAVDYLGGNGAELIFSDGTRMTRTLKAAVFLDVAGWLGAASC